MPAWLNAVKAASISFGNSAEPSTNLDDYVSASATGKYDLVNPKGILTDILGKAGASPTVTVGARAAADLIL